MTPRARLTWRVAPILFLVVLLSTFFFIRSRALRALHTSSAALESEQNFLFTVEELKPLINAQFEWISAPAVFTHTIEFQGKLYICGPAGLFEYGENGALLKQYRVGRELPTSPLVAMTTGVLRGANDTQLILASESEGILVFDGAGFQQIRPEAAPVRAITNIIPTASGNLLIGTKKNGLLVYDGSRLSYLHPTLRTQHITALAGDDNDLWIGTLNDGLLHWHAGQTEHFSEAEGLPDVAVHSLARSGDRVFAGTSAGIAEFDGGKFARLLTRGTFARSLLVRDDRLLVGTMDEGLLEVPLTQARASFGRSSPTAQLDSVQQMYASADKTFALTSSGLYMRTARSLGWTRVLSPESAVLADRNISALNVDSSGRLWVGYFDRGLDIVDPGFRRATHVENDHVFCVNRIVSDKARNLTAVATANGLVMFDAAGRQQQVLGRRDGIIADHVTDVAFHGAETVVSTPAGLTFMDSAGARSLYAFHGLVNNHVYALGVSGDQVMAGTLGGISVLHGDNVIANLTTSSGLKHNWITAIVPVADEWMIGTYGAGVVGLDNTGRFRAFDVATGKFEVNPNAMLVTDRHVFAGSLGSGVYMFDRARQRWSQLTQGLPSLNVTAFAAADGYLYIGTDNGLVRVPEQALQ